MSYAGAQDRGRQLGAVNPLAIINTATGVTGIVTGLFSSDGPDKDKYAERGKFISSLVGMAQAGDITAWHALGAYGWPKIKSPVPLSNPYSRPPKFGGKVQTHPIGWALAGNEWGDAYKPLRESANDAYQKLAYKFNPAAPPPASSGPIVIPPMPPITTGWPTGGGSGGNGNNLPVYQPTPSYLPATMDPAYPAGGPAPVAQAGLFGLSPAVIGGGLALGLLVLATQQPRRNPPRRTSRRGRR